MEVTELRIGNLVKMHNKIIVMDNRIFHAVIHGFKGYEPKPVKITENWLLKFGFIKTSVNDFFLGNMSIRLITERRNGVEMVMIFVNDHIINTRMKYIHQLQNLWLVLKEQELILKS